MQKCRVCGIEKNLEDFPLRSKLLEKYHSICKICHNDRIRQYYRNNKFYYISKSKKRKNNLRKIVQHLKEANGCEDCGIKYPYYILDFDHTGNDKVINISKAVTKKQLYPELLKCDIVCANCHRERTHKRTLGLNRV